MDLLAWFLFLVVSLYVAVLTIKTAKPLYRFNKVKEKVIEVDGFIVKTYGEEKTKIKGEKVRSFYPVYECLINNQNKTLEGLVRYIDDGNNILGMQVKMLYDEETGELWCERDLPLMRKQIKVRLLTTATLLILMIITSVML